MWYRIFGGSEIVPSPAALVERLANAGLSVEPHFKGDDLGWTTGELHLPRGGPVLLARYLTREDDLRDDLNAFAAELETMDYDKNNQMLMERVIQTQQMITLRKPVDAPDESLIDRIIETCCQHLALQCDGIFQADGQGWFATDGTRLLEEY